MSENLKGDTSRQSATATIKRTPAAPVITNPLLSAAVTGISLDDFPNKPLLLPPVAISREPKSLVTVGSPTDVDTENLDEINLNTSCEESVTAATTDSNANPVWEANNTLGDSILSQAASSFSALPSVASNVLSTFSKRISEYSGTSSRERTPNSDSNDNNLNAPQLEIQPNFIQQIPQHQQAATLPTSGLFYPSTQPLQHLLQQTLQPPPTAIVPPPSAIALPPSAVPLQPSAATVPQPTSYQPINTLNSSISLTSSSTPFTCADAKVNAEANLTPPEPPKFYTPAEVPILPTVSGATPLTSGQNTYRLSAKKKIYAPIPGLSDQTARATAPGIDPLITATPIQGPPHTHQPFDPYGYAVADSNYSPNLQQPPSFSKSEDRKFGLLSNITNLVPTGVLQNISGLVQSATGTFTQSAKSAEPEAPELNYGVPTLHSPDSVQYFGGQIAPPQQQYTTPTSVLHTSAPTANIPILEHSPITHTSQDSPSVAASLFTPQNISGALQTEPNKTAALPKIDTPESLQPSVASLTSHTPITFFDPTKQKTTTTSALFTPVTPVSATLTPKSGETTAKTSIKVFDPTKQSVETATPSSFFNTSTSLAPSLTETPLSVPPTVINDITSSAVPQVESSQTTTFNTSTLFNPQAPSPATSNPFLNVHQSQALLPPKVPTASLSHTQQQQPPPPPTAGSAASFRLQKGTRLYKSPLTSVETAPSYGGSAIGIIQPQSTPQTLFNPFVPTDAAAAAIPNPFPAVPPYILPPTTISQSVSLYTPGQGEVPGKQTGIKDYSSTPLGIALSDPKTAEVHPINPSIVPSITDSETTENNYVFFEQQTIEPVLPEAVDLKLTEDENNHKTEQSQRVTISPEEADSLDKTLAQFSLTESESKQTELLSVPLTTPPNGATQHVLEPKANPYRRGSASTSVRDKAVPALVQKADEPKLANFFADTLGISSGGTHDFSLFAAPQLQQSEGSILKEIHTTKQILPSAPSAAGFFSTAATAAETPFVAQPQFPALPPLVNTSVPPHAPVRQERDFDVPEVSSIPPPIGFDNIIAPPTKLSSVENNNITQTTSANPSVDASGIASSAPTTSSNSTRVKTAVNTFTNYFGDNSNSTIQNSQQQPGAELQQQQGNIVDSASVLFFDTFAPQKLGSDTTYGTAPASAEVNSDLPTEEQQKQQQQQQHDQQQQQLTPAQSNEDQRLQYFFNNPPPKENSAGAGDLNYDLVHSGLGIRNLPTRSLTPVSNLVEPPSSACSEFSELNNSNASAKIQPTEALSESSSIKNLSAVTSEPIKNYQDLPEDVLQELRMANVLTGEKAAASAPPTAVTYAPAVKHWFYKRPHGASKFAWTPFSHLDSALLETSLIGDNAANVVAVEGGRYDVNISERTKVPVYWEGTPIEVRRCSWFYKGTDSKYVPYEEGIADLLEAEYKQAVESGEWHKKIMLSMGEYVNFHGPTVMVHFQQQQSTDAWGGTSQSSARPRVVKRDLDDFTIEQGESQRVDHLLFMVHGIGSACDLRMRSVEEVVDDFRSIAQQLVQSHYKNSTEMGIVGRVEVLPISWHSHLHSEEMGIDEKLRSITLESIPKLRNFANDTLLDVLFYTSPTFCQKIMDTVGTSMNTVYSKYRQRHPDFNGGVSLAGHSLGSLILFDLLCHQKAYEESEDKNMENSEQNLSLSQTNTYNNDSNRSEYMDNQGGRIASRQISYTMGPGTGQPFIHYPQLSFEPKKFFALGSPIGMFVTIRGIDKLGLDFRLPTCSGFYNIFHPFDPVAYRIEALVNPDLSGVRPVLIPHHKGRKRMHLELKETMTRVGADIKQRFLDTFKNTLDSVNFLGVSTKSKTEAEESMKKEVDKVLSMQMQIDQEEPGTSQKIEQCESDHSQVHPMSGDIARTRTDSDSTIHSDDIVEIDFPLGKLNDSKRIDYVLQEAPLEFFNEYIFALSSHVCYWESEDTILFVMKEIYTGLGISPDSQVPQQTMTIERPSSRTGTATPSLLSPISEKR